MTYAYIHNHIHDTLSLAFKHECIVAQMRLIIIIIIIIIINLLLSVIIKKM